MNSNRGPLIKILHIKRDWYQSADQLTSVALHQKGKSSRCRLKKIPGLEAINRLPELLVSKDQSPSTKIYAVIRLRSPIRISEKTIQDEVVQRIREDRI